VPELPSADYLGIRKCILELDQNLNLDPCKPLKGEDEDQDEFFAIAIDATGVSVDRVERKHGKKRYIKLSFALAFTSTY
jgi:hypothetical protein